MSTPLRQIVRVTICAMTVAGASLRGDIASAQWYRTYDEAIRAFNASNLPVAEARLNDAKKEAEAAGRRPGRSVLRYGGLREPFIPDFWLGQVYAKLADEAQDTAARARFQQQARDAFALATSTGQVRERDSENATLQAAVEKLGAPAGKPATPGPSVTPAASDTQPRADPLAAAREEIRRLVDTGERAMASRSWDAAANAFQDASRRLDAAPSLRTEFPRVTAGVNDAALGRQYDNALEQLNAGRYAAAIDTFDQLGRQSEARTPSPEMRSVLADAPRRLADARLGQSIAAADAAFRESRWTAARDAYESIQRQAEAGDIATARVRESFAQVPERLTEVRLNLAIGERRFADALAIDPRNTRALAGEYDLGLAAYNKGQWTDAVRSFALVSAGAVFRDAAARKIAAEMQVEFAAGVAAEISDPQAARAHYERVQELKNTIQGALLNSPVVVEAAENASSRVRRLTANDALKNARLDYENGRWDQALNNVQLVLSIFPGDADATDLRRKLTNQELKETIDDLANTARQAESSGDLAAARDAATRLSALMPGNEVAREVLAAVDTSLALQREAGARRTRWLVALAAAAAVPPLLLISPRRRGRFFAAVGQPARALRIYQRVLSQNPTDGAILRQASALASTHGIDVPLETYFEQYLGAKPNDATIAQTAADYFWKTGRRARAVELYVGTITGGTTALPPDVYRRLDEFYATGIPAEALEVFEQGVGTANPPAGLVVLVAREYARRERIDREALAVYQQARGVDGSDQSIRRMRAQSLLAQGDHADAIVEAEAALTAQPDDDRALAVVLDAYSSAFAGAPGQAVDRLKQLPVPLSVLFIIGERLSTAHPGLQPMLQPLYRQRAPTDAELALQPLVEAARVLDTDLNEARARLDSAYAQRGKSALVARALIQTLGRHLDLAQQRGLPADADLQARVAELHTETGAWEAAIGAWQQIVSTPEWSRRSMSAIEAILDPLDLWDTVRTYFSTAGWCVAARADTPGVRDSLRLTPGAGVNAELGRRFQDTQVFCQTSVVSVDDIVESEAGGPRTGERRRGRDRVPYHELRGSARRVRADLRVHDRIAGRHVHSARCAVDPRRDCRSPQRVASRAHAPSVAGSHRHLRNAQPGVERRDVLRTGSVHQPARAQDLAWRELRHLRTAQDRQDVARLPTARSVARSPRRLRRSAGSLVAPGRRGVRATDWRA